MKLKIFIDSDIILDVLAMRDPFYKSAAALFSMVEKRKIEGFTSPIVFSNIHYILRKRSSRQNTLENLKYLKNLIQILPVNKRTIELALDSSFEDFEDAIQYQCTEQNRINYFITRNKADYPKVKITILNAQEFLAMLHTLDSN
jgi:predicted nucleic acid-binding protein